MNEHESDPMNASDPTDAPDEASSDTSSGENPDAGESAAGGDSFADEAARLAAEAAAEPTPIDPRDAKIKSLEERLDQALRQLADRDNRVKRLQRDMPRQLEAREEGVLKKVLEIVDNFERARDSMQGSVDVDRLREGTDMIFEQFKGFLAGYQVKAMDSQGKVFDPNWHEAVGQAPSPDVPEGHVLAVVQPGYTYKERVLRHARVIVAMAPPDAQPTPPPSPTETDESGGEPVN